MTYLKKLVELLKEEMPRETVFVCSGRAAGRRLLALAGREELLLGVRVETPLTLAMELCAEKLSHPEEQRLMDDTEAAELVLNCLTETRTGYFSVSGARCLAAAREVNQAFRDLDMACVEDLVKDNGQKDAGKLEDLAELRRAYRKKKAGQKLWDRGDLFQNAILAAEKDGEPLRRARYVVLASYAPQPLERKLLDTLSGGRVVAVPMDFPQECEPPADVWDGSMPRTAPLAGKKDRVRAYACRGVDTELRQLFRTLLRERQTTSLDDCAVVYLSGEYGQLLYEAAARYHVPVSMAAGVPMTASPLYSALSRVALLTESKFDAERVRELLLDGVFQLQDSFQLMEALRREYVGGGKDRYARVWINLKPKENTDEARQAADTLRQEWESFFQRIFTLAEPGEAELDRQKECLLDLLAKNVFHITPEQQAAYSCVRNLVGRVQALLPGETLLKRVLEMMGTATYRRQSGAPGTLLCLPLTQALYTNCKKLYILGLSRYSLESGKRENAVLLDDERAKLKPLKTGEETSRERAFLFWQLLLQHDGDVVLSYSDFDITRVTPMQPSPALRIVCDRCGIPQPEQVSYLPGEEMTLWDHVLGEKKLNILPPKPAAAAGKPVQPRELKELLAEFPFSPTSLEAALKCPLQFYFQHILRLPDRKQQERGDKSWLAATEIGIVCHRVLENYYRYMPEKETDDRAEQRLNDLLADQWKEIEALYPPVAKALMDADKKRMEEMIRRAINWTKKNERTVLATEKEFGKGSILTLKVGKRSFRLQGTIDRVDRLKDGGCAILDYKTSKPDRFDQELEQDLHLQHYLYTLAEEALHPERYVREAGYLLMAEGGSYRSFPVGEKPEDYRKRYEEKVELLLEWLEDEEKIQTPRPCFRVENHKLEPGDEETRAAALASCRHMCSYSALCMLLKGE